MKIYDFRVNIPDVENLIFGYIGNALPLEDNEQHTYLNFMYANSYFLGGFFYAKKQI